MALASSDDHGAKKATPTIVVGVDGSAAGTAALQWAAHQAKLTNARLRVVMAWQTSGSETWPAAPVPAPAGDQALQSRLTLRRLVAHVLGDPPPVQIITQAIQGSPAPVLLDAAQGASLLVLGDRGTGGFAGLRLGSVGLHCVTHASCPVVITRATDGALDHQAVPVS